MDTRLRNLLHDLASDMPVELETTGPPTLRKARGRRALTGAGVVVAMVAFVAVSLSAIRLASDPEAPVPTTTGPNPATFPGLWPETDPGALAETQAAVDEGHMPLRTTPDGTASLLAVNLLGWQEGDVQVERRAADADEATVVISNRILGDDVPPITVELRQLGDTGENGIWSVVGVSSPLIEVEDVTLMMLTDPVAQQLGPGSLRVSGFVTDLFEGATFLEASVLAGPDLRDAVGGATLKLGTDDDDTSASRRRFTFKAYVAGTPSGTAALMLRLPDATGASLGAVMVPVETPVGEPPSTGPNLIDVPSDVAATAQQIYDAAKAKDFDALRELLDPNTFTYNFNPGADPTPEWRENPSELDLMVAILEMPPTSREVEGTGTLYFWPYLVNSDFSSLTPQEMADLNALGYTDEEIQLMVANPELGYQGPRLAIDENGEWRNFITVGE